MIRAGGASAGSAIGVGVDAVGRKRPVRPLWDTPTGSYVQSIFNALWGDRFDEDQSAFSISFGIRDADGAPVGVDAASLRQAFPDAKRRLVVMLHGLGETERCWSNDGAQDLPGVLEVDGFSVLSMRYNTGRRISENGLDLAHLLEDIVRSWPVSVEDIVLVGHSMGGLVARSAVSDTQVTEQKWVGLVHHLVAIGAPHLGTPIEKAVHLAGNALNVVSETRPLGAFVGQRSNGIKDLHSGPIIDEDDSGAIRQLFIAGAIADNPRHPVSMLVGDLVVRLNSATGRGRRRHVPATKVLVVGGRSHAALLSDADVHASIREFLASG